MSAAPPLKQLGRYQLTRVLGKGAMGVVYEGVDPRLNRSVAVKTILKSQLLDAETAADYSARFVREAQAVARLNHPNIVMVFDFGEENDIAYIVMEYIRGRELKDYFDENEFFDIPQAINIMCQLLDALEFAHQQGIIHRDIKPANLMIDMGGRVKLTDFGVARMADPGHDRTVSGTMVGTPSYMSPEQIQGTPVGPRSDLFAAGVILYQFLTHEKPFTGQGQWTIQKKIVQEDPSPPSFVNAAVPTVFDAIVSRALAKNPEDRYPSATAFATDLKRVLAGMPVDDEDATRISPAKPAPPQAAAPAAQAAPVPTVPPAAPPPAPVVSDEPPHWAQETVALKSTPTPSARGEVAASPSPSAKPAATAAPAAPPPVAKPKSQAPLIAGLAVAVAAVAGGAWFALRNDAKPPAQVATIDQRANQKPAAPEPDAETIRQQRLEEEIRRQEDDARRRAEEEARQKVEAERQRRAADEQRKADEDAARARAQEDARQRADETARRKAEDLERRKAAEAEALQRKSAEAEAQRKAAEAEAQRKAVEAEAQRKAAEAKAQRDAAEAEARRKAEAEAQRKSAEAEAQRKAQEEARRKADEEKKRLTPDELMAQAARLEADGKVSGAVKLYRQAANAGSGEAAKRLGDIYGRGSGDVGRDYAESVKWYGVARDRGIEVPLARSR